MSMINEKISNKNFVIRFCVITFVLFSLAFCGSAIPYEEWRKGFIGSDDVIFKSVKQTSDGGYIITGSREMNTRSDYNVLLIKTDKEGNRQWEKILEGSSEEGANSIIDIKDGYILLGWTLSYGAGAKDIWLIKTDKNGEKLWSRTFGGKSNEEAYDFRQTSDNGYILAGCTNSFGNGDFDAWLIKTDANGNIQWNKTFGGKGTDCATSVQQTLDGGYIIAGSTGPYEENDMKLRGEDVELPYLGRGFKLKFSRYEGFWNSPWLIKTDIDGNEQWNRTFRKKSIFKNEGIFVRQTSDKGYLITGHSGLIQTDSRGIVKTDEHGVVNFDLTRYTTWLIKSDSEGIEQWNRTLGSSKSDDINSLVGTIDGGYIIAGGTISNDGTDDEDARLIKIDANGNEQWNKTFGRFTNLDIATSVFQTSDGGYIISSVELVGGVVTQKSFIVDINGERDSWLIKVGNKGVDPTISAPKVTEIKKTPDVTPVKIKNTSEIIFRDVENTPESTPTEINKTVGKSTAGFEIFGLIFSIALLFILGGKRNKK